MCVKQTINRLMRRDSNDRFIPAVAYIPYTNIAVLTYTIISYMQSVDCIVVAMNTVYYKRCYIFKIYDTSTYEIYVYQLLTNDWA
jgi:hypothetical protein